MGWPAGARSALAAAGVLLVASTVLMAGGVARADSGVSAGDETQFVAAINQVRTGHGLRTLAVNSSLVAMARQWAQTMAGSGLRHNPDVAAEAPPGWAVLGENVGKGPTVTDIEDAFVASPHHYENMADAGFNALGVGVFVDEGVVWVAEEFMAGGGEPAPASPAAPPSAAPQQSQQSQQSQPQPAATPAAAPV